MDSEAIPLNKREQAFIDSFVVCLNKRKAAIDAGYSEGCAKQRGYDIYNRLHVKEAIEEKLKERTSTSNEVVKWIDNVKHGNMADYFKEVQVLHTPRIIVSLQVIIDRIQEEIDFEDEYRQAVIMTEEENDSWFKDQQSKRDRKLRYEIELKRNPLATRIIDGETQFITEMQLDIAAVIADKERGIIKSVKYTKEGIQIEMYSALDAAEKLLKVHGAYEKDNEQSRPLVPKIMRVEIVPPLPIDE